MGKATDVRPVSCSLYFLPVETRVPLKFGPETLSHVTLARVRLRLADRSGRVADGWGETPLSVQWVWPSSLTYDERHTALTEITDRLAGAWADFDVFGHPLEVGSDFTKERLLKELGGMDLYLTSHFKERWGINKDIYAISIEKNMKYLNYILQHHEHE